MVKNCLFLRLFSSFNLIITKTSSSKNIFKNNNYLLTWIWTIIGKNTKFISIFGIKLFIRFLVCDVYGK